MNYLDFYNTNNFEIFESIDAKFLQIGMLIGIPEVGIETYIFKK